MLRSSKMESLESRNLHAGGVDASFDFDRSALEAVIGKNARIHAAVAGPGDRTYLLAERYIDGSVDAAFFGPRFITIVAIDKGGKLDRGFNGDGVALSNRQFDDQSSITPPALLRVDSFGRSYVIDNKRVLRFDPNGWADPHFADRGQAVLRFTGTLPQVQDAVANDDGTVHFATLSTTKGVQRSDLFTVSGGRVTLRYRHEYDTGHTGNANDGRYFSTGFDAHVRLDKNDQALALTIVNTHAATIEHYIDGESGEPANRISQDGSRVHVATFGRGLRRIAEADMEPIRPAESTQLLDTYVSPTGKTVIVLSDREQMRIGVRDGTRRRTPLPDNGPAGWAVGAIAPNGQLYLGDETSGVDKRGKTEHYHVVRRLTAAGGLDQTFGARGSLTVLHTDGNPGYEGVIDEIIFGTRTLAPYLFSSVTGDAAALRRLVI